MSESDRPSQRDTIKPDPPIPTFEEQVLAKLAAINANLGLLSGEMATLNSRMTMLEELRGQVGNHRTRIARLENDSHTHNGESMNNGQA